jgi:hypothetical protein
MARYSYECYAAPSQAVRRSQSDLSPHLLELNRHCGQRPASRAKARGGWVVGWPTDNPSGDETEGRRDGPTHPLLRDFGRHDDGAEVEDK